jgi:hypothetical protein
VAVAQYSLPCFVVVVVVGSGFHVPASLHSLVPCVGLLATEKKRKKTEKGTVFMRFR